MAPARGTGTRETAGSAPAPARGGDGEDGGENGEDEVDGEGGGEDEGSPDERSPDLDPIGLQAAAMETRRGNTR